MQETFSYLGLPIVALVAAGCLGVGHEVRSEQAMAPVDPALQAIVREAETFGAEARHAVERSLPYLEEHGVAWMEEHNCSSCHQVPVMMWSFHSAAARGLEVDRARLREWTSWVADESPRAGPGNSVGIAQMILARPSGPDGRELEELAPLVAGAQQDDGSWEAGGQLPTQRRPVDETHRTATGWAVLALASTGGEGEALARGRERFEPWLEENGASLEWLVVRLLYADRFGDAAHRDALLGRLLAEQRPDGGWAWLLGEDSDAFGTGLGLYALGRLGHPEIAAVHRAREYLAGTQLDDGSWKVRSTLEHEHGPTPTSDYWGTGWAAIGLLSTLDKPS